MVHYQPYSFFIDAIVHKFSITIVDLISLSKVHIDYKCLHGIITFYWLNRNQCICYRFSSNCLSNYSPLLYAINCLYSFPLAFLEFLRTW
uniref:Uncharacterized protein n=1 Tax=Saimiri boliviensis boliviensis TaxID=39432 RepID=A0A2K6SFI9_SAIBB